MKYTGSPAAMVTIMGTGSADVPGFGASPTSGKASFTDG
jgi:hypothetical protein